MIVHSVSSAATFIIQARDDDLHMLKYEGLISTLCDKSSSDLNISAILPNHFQHSNKQTDGQNAVEELVKF